jgi:hypothetical protein
MTSIGEQLPADRADVFRAHDLPEAIEALSLVDWWSLPEVEQSPGIRRFTVAAARTVAGTTCWSASIPWAEDPGALVVHVIDIWTDRWPADE